MEIFIAGAKLKPRSSIVRSHLQHDRWQAGAEAPFEANRVVLPEEPHFTSVAALIATEMLRAGFGGGIRDHHDVFAEVEPLVELALGRSSLPEAVVLGLVGELICLEQLLLGVADAPGLRSSVLDTWRGHQHAARDFSLGDAAIEVKTTTDASSTHTAHSLNQIEPVATDGRFEQQLYLLSVGLQRSDQGGVTLPDTVDRILFLLSDSGIDASKRSPLQSRFLHDLEQYGTHSGASYVHDEMSGLKVYQTVYTPTFVPRMYDLCDQSVALLRRQDLEGMFVLPDRIQYGFTLPDRVSPANPLPTWQTEVRTAIRRRLGLAVTPC